MLISFDWVHIYIGLAALAVVLIVLWKKQI